MGQVLNLCPILSEKTQGTDDLAQWGKSICVQCVMERDQERICHNSEEEDHAVPSQKRVSRFQGCLEGIYSVRTLVVM